MKLQEHLKTKPFNEISGIYFLLDDKNDVVYIGSSRNVGGMIIGHWSDARKPFSRYAVLKLEKHISLEDLLNIEADFIAKYEPVLNKSMPGTSWVMVKGTSKQQNKIIDNHRDTCVINGATYYDVTSKISNKNKNPQL